MAEPARLTRPDRRCRNAHALTFGGISARRGREHEKFRWDGEPAPQIIACGKRTASFKFAAADDILLTVNRSKRFTIQHNCMAKPDLSMFDDVARGS
ncbi:hypothetical protein K7H91_18715 [Martelella mediterranea]|uniref:hypothetical protein n=1 Tax=Martelella mediterranea TaxID=293089 RepID=UPI001E5370D9|nr:hypothetical protein [Martelella mediterranea]MCD1635804.1 hypothetical protein [Martelella mediterranea]